MLRNYINAIIGFEKPGKELDKQAKSLRGMLSERRNPLAKKTFKNYKFRFPDIGVDFDQP